MGIWGSRGAGSNAGFGDSESLGIDIQRRQRISQCDCRCHASHQPFNPSIRILCVPRARVQGPTQPTPNIPPSREPPCALRRVPRARPLPASTQKGLGGLGLEFGSGAAEPTRCFTHRPTCTCMASTAAPAKPYTRKADRVRRKRARGLSLLVLSAESHLMGDHQGDARALALFLFVSVRTDIYIYISLYRYIYI